MIGFMIDFVAILRSIRGYTNQIVHIERLPARAARYAEPSAPLPPPLAAALAARGISRLYTHQAAALEAARAGHHIGIVTATASGKTLCYQLPTIEAVLSDPAARALFLFPTKALAADQLRALNALLEALEAAGGPLLTAATLDGDTPRATRDRVRAGAHIILSNPDLLHRTLLPDHVRWQSVLARLRYVVLDEAHTYRGVFGTHVALILRRLRRLCAHYGSAPQFICCSATSANPQQHLAALIGDEVQIIDDDGAPQGERAFLFWNPPVIDNQRVPAWMRALLPENGQRRSTNVEMANVLATLVRAGVKTLAFTRTRRSAELVLRYAREGLDTGAPEENGHNPSTSRAEQIAAYRAGYTVEDRRRLEQTFARGDLRGLVSTNALELGVDIGGVDAVVIGGFPGTIASAWQQAGRAGRSQGKSLAVLVAQDDPLDQFYMRHPAEFFSRPHEHARVALDNPYILRDQLRCAAAELPLHDADKVWFGATFAKLRDWLLRRGELTTLPDGRAAYASAARPAAHVNIRSADGDPIDLIDSDSGRRIEQIAATRAPFEVFPGAVYMHQGDTYVVAELTSRQALARRVQVEYYTRTIDETEIAVRQVRQQRQVGPATLSLGVVDVTRQVVGYKRKKHYTDEVISEHDLSMPPQTFRTIAVWWTIPEPICRQVAQVCDDALDGLHAMEHAAIGLLPLFAQCDRADIGGLSTDAHPDTGAATIFVYDGVPGGVGIAEVGYEQAVQWWEQTWRLLIDCPCSEGCPACIQSPKCGNANQHLSKIGAATLVALLTGHAPPLPGAFGKTTMSAAFIEDLQRQLARARSEPPGVRRTAVLVALRYRIATGRASISDDAGRAALAMIEAEANALQR
jgi:DEAD/DEAH box helicase domain-containing protein